VRRLTALFWLGGIVHSLGSGTDSGTWWFLGLTGVVVVPAAAMLIARHLPRSGRYTSPEDPARPLASRDGRKESATRLPLCAI
jgi:hypothetical protein